MFTHLLEQIHERLLYLKTIKTTNWNVYLYTSRDTHADFMLIEHNLSNREYCIVFSVNDVPIKDIERFFNDNVYLDEEDIVYKYSDIAYAIY